MMNKLIDKNTQARVHWNTYGNRCFNRWWGCGNMDCPLIWYT